MSIFLKFKISLEGFKEKSNLKNIISTIQLYPPSPLWSESSPFIGDKQFLSSLSFSSLPYFRFSLQFSKRNQIYHHHRPNHPNTPPITPQLQMAKWPKCTKTSTKVFFLLATHSSSSQQKTNKLVSTQKPHQPSAVVQ